MEENFVTQMVMEAVREGPHWICCLQTFMDDVMVRGPLGHRDHKMTDFSILRETRRWASRTATLDFWRGRL